MHFTVIGNFNERRCIVITYTYMYTYTCMYAAEHYRILYGNKYFYFCADFERSPWNVVATVSTYNDVCVLRVRVCV